MKTGERREHENSAEQQKLGRASSSWSIFHLQHRSTITTVARPQLAGSVEPATRAKQHYITGYIQWHYAVYRFTDCTFLFSFLPLLNSLLFHCLWKPPNKCAQNDPPNKCAKMTRQNILPWRSAGFTRGNNLPNLLARKICHFNSWLACQRSPLPCSKSPGKTRPATLPPPRSGGEGAGGRPGPPTHIEQVLFLSFPISWMATYSCITRYIHILHRAD